MNSRQIERTLIQGNIIDSAQINDKTMVNRPKHILLDHVIQVSLFKILGRLMINRINFKVNSEKQRK